MAAEFVVIALGVLAGLAAEEWRQGRADLRLQDEYSVRLARDLGADSASWAALLPITEAKEAALERVLTWLEAPDRSPSSVTRFASDLVVGSRLAFGGRTEGNRSTFDELISTGRLGLIPSTSLRDGLLTYYRRLTVDQTLLEGRETDYAPRVYELVPRLSEVADAELTPRELQRIAERALDGDLAGLATAELNRALYRRQIAQALVT